MIVIINLVDFFTQVYGKLGENKSVKVLEETIQVVLLEGEEENDYLTKAEERVDAANKNLDIPLSTSTTDETSSDDEAGKCHLSLT